MMHFDLIKLQYSRPVKSELSWSFLVKMLTKCVPSHGTLGFNGSIISQWENVPSNKMSTAAGLENMLVDNERGGKKGTCVIDTDIHSWWNQFQCTQVVLASLSITCAKEKATASSCGNQQDNCAAVVKEQSAEKWFAFAFPDSWYFPDKLLPFVVLVALKDQPT